MTTNNLIECSTHGRVRGYVVCVHLMQGQPCVHFVEGDLDAESEVAGLGEALCARCHFGDHELNLDDLKLICEYCLKGKILPSSTTH